MTESDGKRIARYIVIGIFVYLLIGTLLYCGFT